MNTEPTINNRLAECLRQRHPEWRDDAVVSEQTGVLLDEPLKKPDVLIRSGAPVIVEAEIAPASTVDHDAIERLNRSVEGATLPVEAAIALVYPGRFRDTVRESDLDAALSDAVDLAWRIFFTSETGTPSRFPTSGAIRGSVDDLAAAIETLTISPRHIEEAADTLARAVARASGILTGLSDGCRQQIGDFLHQAPDPQTMRMASAVIADAFLCQTAIAEGCSTPNIDATRTRGTSRGLNKRHVLDVWHEILAVNYYPVFSLASRVLTAVPDNKAGAVCDRLAAAAQDLAAAGAVEVQDLAGQMLGRLIADRKFLATFYTRPASATLLAELAALRLEVDWSDPEAVAGLRIADLACGTGALLSAAYRRVAARHRRRGKDPAQVHKEMMRQSLIGADVMPAAAHLTTMMLSAAHPAKPFDACEIHVVPYGLTAAGRDLLEAGREEDLEVKHVRLGSLELMAKDQTGSLIGQESTRLAGREGSVREDDTAFELSAGSVDLMIMNPPFTRPTGHESDKVGVPVPSFAGLSTSPSAQKKMSQRLKRLRPPHGSAGHGNAGLASDFIDLAHNKLRPGGVLALILPAQIVAGESWTSARKLLRDHYSDVVVVTIAAADSSTSRAFSADTGMAEPLRGNQDRSLSQPRTPTPSRWTSREPTRPPTRCCITGLRRCWKLLRHLEPSSQFAASLGRSRCASGATRSDGSRKPISSPKPAATPPAFTVPMLPTPLGASLLVRICGSRVCAPKHCAPSPSGLSATEAPTTLTSTASPQVRESRPAAPSTSARLFGPSTRRRLGRSCGPTNTIIRTRRR